jgi:WD40 repeat protein
MTLGDDYDTVLVADIRPDQSQVAMGGPGRLVKIFATGTGDLQHKIKKHTDWVTALAFSPNGQILASADRNGGISLWDPDNGQELFTLAGHKSAVTTLSWRPDSKLLASSSEDGTVKLWETKEGKQVKSWSAHSSGTLCVAYARDGHLATCGRDKKVTLWDGNGSRKRDFEFFGNIPLRIAFTSEGSQLVGSDFLGRVALWNTADPKRVAELDANPLTLDEQLAAEQNHCDALTATSPLAGTNTNLTTKPSAAARFKTARVLSYVFAARESLAFRKRELAVLSALTAEPAGAHPSTPKTGSQAATVKAEQSSPAAHRLAAQVAADEARLQRLLDYYHSLKAEN